MADDVASQTIHNGPRNVVMKFTNVSDSTGETAVTKVDASALNAEDLRIDKIHYATSGMAVRILWDADSDVDAFLVPTDGEGWFDFCQFGGLTNNAGAGVTGDINFTTIGADLDDMYTIVLEMTKRGV